MGVPRAQLKDEDCMAELGELAASLRKRVLPPRVLRFGSTRRQDGRVHKELRHHPMFLALRDTFWELEVVR
jgi:hypothetical protein